MFSDRHLHPRHGFPLIPPERHICTQATALALGLPAKLSRLADALELANRKDAAGEKLMLQMARPRKRRKDETAEGLSISTIPSGCAAVWLLQARCRGRARTL